MATLSTFLAKYRTGSRAVGAANKAGLYGSRSHAGLRTCPGCGQPITFDQGYTECGGEGEGICANAVFAYDQKTRGRPYAVAEWKGMWDNERTMPTKKMCEAILAAHDSVASERYIVVSIHNGTDWGVFKASPEDMDRGDDMSHAEAIQTAKDAAAGQKGARWYDFGDDEYNEE
jgi:hypothetical protein